MGFTGTISAKLDAKGRVFFPSEFRKILPDEDSALIVRRDLYQPCLVVYPRCAWNEELTWFRQNLNRRIFHEAMLFRQFMAEVELLTLDASGRFLIPKHLLQAARIDGAVVFLGVDDRVEIWSPEVKNACFLPDADLAKVMEKAGSATIE